MRVSFTKCRWTGFIMTLRSLLHFTWPAPARAQDPSLADGSPLRSALTGSSLVHPACLESAGPQAVAESISCVMTSGNKFP